MVCTSDPTSARSSDPQNTRSTHFAKRDRAPNGMESADDIQGYASDHQQHPRDGIIRDSPHPWPIVRDIMPTSPKSHQPNRIQLPIHRPIVTDDRPSPSARGYDRTWQRLRRMVLHSNPLCAECGQPAREVHHIKPISEGGERLEMANLMPVCPSCHSRITAQGRRGIGGRASGALRACTDRRTVDHKLTGNKTKGGQHG